MKVSFVSARLNSQIEFLFTIEDSILAGELGPDIKEHFILPLRVSLKFDASRASGLRPQSLSVSADVSALMGSSIMRSTMMPARSSLNQSELVKRCVSICASMRGHPSHGSDWRLKLFAPTFWSPFVEILSGNILVGGLSTFLGLAKLMLGSNHPTGIDGETREL